MKNYFLLLPLVLLALSGCGNSQVDTDQAAFAQVPAVPASPSKTYKLNDTTLKILDDAETNASAGSLLVLQMARAMIVAKDLVIGSCWDYIHAIYVKAGYEIKDRDTLFKSKKEGPFADTKTILPGDWLYFINHSFEDHEHSAIFVAWINEETQEALTISYAGGDSKTPARYRSYILSSVYNIMRPKQPKQ